MNSSSTVCVSQEGPANALALNKDCSQVVIAGRNVFKVFGIGENEFTEVCNLRVGKNLNLNFSSIDVAWSSLEENTLATAATNGAVVVWNLGRSGRSKQEHVFSDHKRTVNKVSFHLTEPSLLISGSQDGMMKCFDLRMKEVARTFISNTESIRDVQFSPRAAHAFAAVSENGSAQLWDARRHERPLAQWTAHSGPVFACDWHPEEPWLATASRDKTIKVWDMQAKPALEHTIYTIASVGHVKWRPERKHQVSSCALVLDCAVHVWDVRRPHVPLATFAEQRDVTTAIAWQAPHAFLSSSRDCVLSRHRYAAAAHPALWANPAGAALAARGALAAAASLSPLPRAPPAAPAAPAAGSSALGRKQPGAGALGPAAQAALEQAFGRGARSALTVWAAPAPPPAPPRLPPPGAPPSPALTRALAGENARLAESEERYMTAHLWHVIAMLWGGSEQDAPPARPAPAPALPPRPPRTVHTDSVSAGGGGGAGGVFRNSGVLGLPTLCIYVPPHARDADAECGWVSAASAHYVDVEACDWQLKEEAFPPASPAPAPPAAPVPPAAPAPAPHDLHVHTEAAAAAGGAGAGASPGGSSAGAPGYSHQSSVNTTDSSDSGGGGGGAGGGGGGGGGGGEAPWRAPLPDPAPLVAAALRQHAAAGDVATAAAALLLAPRHRSDLFPYIDEATQEQWLTGYIELLQRRQLFNEATEVVRASWSGGAWGVAQQAAGLGVACAACGRARGGPCCRAQHCAVCRRAVRGLYAWCQGCAHGGHLAHMQRWMQQHRLCPAGCGHQCRL